MVVLGIEQCVGRHAERFAGKRLGLLCNQASTDHRCRHSRDLIQQVFGDRLQCLFSPQHGFFAEKQDNMVESAHGSDPATGLPVFSLYGESRRPSREMFAEIDLLLVDLVDVGTRVYTFLSTLIYCLEAAAEFGREVVVLDRPNPLGGEAVEGNLLQDDCRSFVGLFPLPMRHGMTLGELALMVNQEAGIQAELTVIPMAGWQRRMLFADTGLPWLFPSPNMPNPVTALVYPGQVLWEGTNISEGRGTTLPFELFGAPFFDHAEVLAAVQPPLPGCRLRPVVFEPTANKWAGSPCPGFQILVAEPRAFRPYRTGLALLQAVMACYPGRFAFKPPPYEYEYQRLPLDLILGDTALKEQLATGRDILELEEQWREDLEEFRERRAAYLLYD